MNEAETVFFDSLAEKWDDEEILSTPERVRMILGYLNLTPGMSVLDLGTGTGVLIPYIKEKIGPDGKLVAVDASRGMLDKAVAKYGNIADVQFILSDFENSEVMGRFDRIILYSVYPHLHRAVETLRRLSRDNLNAGGWIAIAFPTDEEFINSIHRERKAESDLLPPAVILADRLAKEGLRTEMLAYGKDRYVVKVY